MAPELLVPTDFGMSGDRPTQPADIYAFGMVIYEVLTGSQPFHEQKWKIFELTHNVVRGTRPAKPDHAEQIGFGGGTWELVEKCWNQESTKRPKIDGVLAHLARVAASSPVVGPTPEKPQECEDHPSELSSSSKRFALPAHHSSHLDAPGKIQLFALTTATPQQRAATTVTPISRVASVDTTSPVSTISTISTVGTFASRVPSSMTSIPSRGSEDSHHSGNHLSNLGTSRLATNLRNHSQMAILAREEVFARDFGQNITHSTFDFGQKTFG